MENNHKDDKEKLMWHLLPLSLIKPVVEIFQYGLKKYGKDLTRVAYLITRSNEKNRYEQVYDQMDIYTAEPHICAASIKAGDVGEVFWRDEFLKELERTLNRG